MCLSCISDRIRLPILVVAFWHVVLVNSTTCQEGFKKLIYLPETESSNIDDIAYWNGKLVMRGNAFNDSLNLWGLSILTMDTTGNLLSYNTIYDTVNHRHNVVNSPSRFIITDDNRFVIPASYFNGRNVVLFITDTTGNEISTHEYPNSEKTIFVEGIQQIGTSFYILGTISRYNGLNDIFIIKTDSLGNYVWNKYYGSAANEYFSDAQVTENSTLVISSKVLLIGGGSQAWIFSVDTSGTIIYDWKGDQDDARVKGGGSFYTTQNGDIIITSLEVKEVLLQGAYNLFNGPTITKLDSNFNFIWKDTLAHFTSAWDNFVDLEYDSTRDEFVAVGQRMVLYYPWYGSLEVWVVKFKPDGEIMWSISDTIASDSIHGVWHLTSGMVFSPEGSIYITGNLETFTNPPNNCGWVIKVTPDGCMDTLCTITSVEKPPDPRKLNYVKVFPNPVEDEINILIHDLSGPGILNLFNLDGRLLLTTTVYQGENTIPIDLPSGIYFYSIFNNNRITATGKIAVH